MNKKTYYELLRDPQWQRKRLEVMERAKFCCERCDSADDTLNVHQSYYEKGCNPWEYPAESLHCLCETCHKEAEVLRRDVNRQIGRLGFSQLQELLGFARALEMEEDTTARHKADNYEVLLGMMRVFVTLNRRELDRSVYSAISIIDSSQLVDGSMLLSAAEELTVIDAALETIEREKPRLEDLDAIFGREAPA